MYMLENFKRILCVAFTLILCVDMLFAQQATGGLRGQITDELGGVIVGATVVIVDSKGVEKSVTTNEQGIFSIGGLTPGNYTVRVNVEGFEPYENTDVSVSAGRRETLNIKLTVAAVRQKVTISSGQSQLSTDPDANAGAIVLKGKDLESLPDDPDDLAAALQAMAGPSAGPNGGQLYIDGFTGMSMPPKEAIREIRINQNPFAAENDRIGFGRIEILTRPGMEKYHGSFFGNYNNSVLNSRNPFVLNRPPSQTRVYGGSFSGPIVAKRASFFVNVFRREVDDNAIINATILDPALNITKFNQAIVVPRRFLEVSPRFDYQLDKNNTLIARYNYSHFSFKNAGIGEFALPSTAFNMSNTEHTLQLTETAIVSPRVVSETRFQYHHNRRDQVGDNSVPRITVQDAFIGGGSQVGLSFNDTSRWELHQFINWVAGKHTFKFGGRLRGVHTDDFSSSNFGGNFIFLGGVAPVLDANNQVVRDGSGQLVLGPITSIERYRRTLLFQKLGLRPSEIIALGGGPTFLSISGGNPLAGVRQIDFGGYAQDDWRIRPNFTLSYGLRYEAQTHIKDQLAFAPRLAFAWSPGSKGSQPARTVIRGGAGIFYERFAENYTLQANRFNGSNQLQFTIADPAILALFPQVPSLDALVAFRQPQNIYKVAADLTSAYTIQSAISIERQLPLGFTLATTYMNSRGLHYLRSRNINAPLPGTFNPRVPSSGVRPFGNIGNIFEYESSGIFKQHLLVFNISNRLNRNFTLFGNYALGKTMSDTDGAGTFPANTYDLRGEFSRSSLDVRHRAFIGGTINLPWAMSLNPFIMVSSGAPFNIVTGIDSNGDTKFTERPALATDLSKPSVKVTRFGAFDLNPGPDQQIIPRNFGQGPGSFTMNLRLSKTIGFGRSTRGAVASAQRRQGGGGGLWQGRGQAGPRGGDVVVGGRMGGPMGPVVFGGGVSDRPYTLTFSVMANNILNHTNPGPPVGNLSSPLFGQSVSLGGLIFGGFGMSAANNRRIEFQVRFNF
jgi:hypothetical protein